MSRTDLSAAFKAAYGADFRSPRQLLVFKFPDAGNVYVSDQPLGAADGLANEYLPIVESWGDLKDSSDPTSTDSGEITQMSLTLWNGGTNPFSDYFLAEYPENVEVELYQWFAGLAESDKAMIDRFVVQDPIEFDEASRLLKLDLVSISVKYDQPVGDILTKEEWPYAADSDIGKGIPVAFGNPGQIPTLKAKTVQKLRLKGSILKNTMSIQVYENLNDLAFPTSGTVLIDEEKIRYSGRTSSALTVIQRGYLTTAAEHLDKREVIQVITDHTFLLYAGPVAAIFNVQILGYPAPSTIYTVRPDLNPARIIFSEKPWVKKFGESTRFLEMQFDSVTASNSALQPANAYDAADLATAACIKPSNPVLALLQATTNTNRGEILRAYLAVEHWSSGQILSDFCEVWVSGIGVVGRLSRPNPNDEIEIDADVDVDHGHNHEIGGEHIHNFTQPAIPVTDPQHPHSGSVSGGTVVDGGDMAFPHVEINYHSGPYPPSYTVYIHYLSQGSVISKSLRFRANMADYSFVEIYTGYTTFRWEYGVSAIDQVLNIAPGVNTIGIHFGHTNVVGARFQILEATLSTNISGSIYANKTNVTASANGGAVKDTGVVGVKEADDVDDLTTANREVNINDQSNPTRTVVNLFDLTNYVNFNWGWFTGREIRVTYSNYLDNQSIYILHAFFDVEYVPTEVVYSDEVTAEVTSAIDYIRPDLAVKKLLTTRAGAMYDDFDNIHSFGNMAFAFGVLGYRLDGLIDAGVTVREAVKQICYQCHSRVFTSSGKIKMVLRTDPTGRRTTANLTASDLQLRSIMVARQPLREVSNKIQLFYKRDWAASDTSSSGYLDSVTKEDAGSISRFGLKTRKDSYNFDLIRDPAMAASVADFYLMSDAWPSAFFTFSAYLKHFSLEKEDILTVSSAFNQMNKVPMVIRSIDRIFGSGKNKSMNLLRIVAENFFYVIVKMSQADTVLIMDALSMMITEIGEYAEALHIIDNLIAQLDLRKADEAILSEALLSVWEIRKELAEAVTASAAVLTDSAFPRADSVSFSDITETWSVYGFGSGGFGIIPFGGLVTAWQQKSPDIIYAFERLTTVLSVYQAATVTVSDSTATSSGFGGNLSSGFGLSPFGW